MIGKLILNNCLHKPLNAVLSIILFTLGVGISSLIILVEFQLKQKLNYDLVDIDMIVGAKGSPLQMVLSTIFQVDHPTGNIPVKEIEKLSRHPYVEKTIPIAMGDYYKESKIVGTTIDYLKKYHAEVETGRINQRPFEIVIGNNMANRYQLKVGMHITSSHGNALDKSEEHKDQQYLITGILKPSNSVINNIAITSVESIWNIHHHEKDNMHDENEEKQVTAALIKFRSPMGVMTLPNWINQNTNLQAAIPIIEINKLLDITGLGLNTLKWIAYLIILVALISIFITMVSRLQERKVEIALMRSLGASKLILFTICITEILVYCAIGIILGMLLSRISLTYLNATQISIPTIEFDNWTIKQDELTVIFSIIGLCLLSTIFPIFKVYQLNIAKTLNEN